MSKLKVYGKNNLYGSLNVDTAKNALLPILAGSLLCDEDIIVDKITYYDDINKMLDILKSLGVKIKEYEHYVILNASNAGNFEVSQELSGSLRASIFLLGPLISRLGMAKVYYPGGCNIGSRPINIHLQLLEELGAKILDQHGYVYVDGKNMKCGNVHLPFPSVGATENIIMASVFLKGTTKIYGCAKEPEIEDLCNFLNSMGAKIKGGGSDYIEIEGVKRLHSTTYEPICDRIIAGTYLMLPLICGGEIEITNVNTDYLMPLISLIKNNTCKIDLFGDKITVSSNGKINGFGLVETMPYPHFPTDLQQPLCATSVYGHGTTVIVENLFENRFKHVPELIKMGAKISVKGRVCVVEGGCETYGANVCAEDLRGGVALLMASLGANGYSTISNADIISRGYFNLDEKLKKIGAKIEKI